MEGHVLEMDEDWKLFKGNKNRKQVLKYEIATKIEYRRLTQIFNLFCVLYVALYLLDYANYDDSVTTPNHFYIIYAIGMIIINSIVMKIKVLKVKEESISFDTLYYRQAEITNKISKGTGKDATYSITLRFSDGEVCDYLVGFKEFYYVKEGTVFLVTNNKELENLHYIIPSNKCNQDELDNESEPETYINNKSKYEGIIQRGESPLFGLLIFEILFMFFNSNKQLELVSIIQDNPSIGATGDTIIVVSYLIIFLYILSNIALLLSILKKNKRFLYGFIGLQAIVLLLHLVITQLFNIVSNGVFMEINQDTVLKLVTMRVIAISCLFLYFIKSQKLQSFFEDTKS